MHTDGKPIVVGYNGSWQAGLALRWAADEALRTGAPVRAVHVLDPPFDPTTWETQYLDPATTMVTDACLRVRTDTGAAVTAEVLIGDPARILTALSAEARLVVLGCGGKDGFIRLLAGPVGITVAARAACSVVLVRSLPTAPDLPVVAGFDDSVWARRAIEYAFTEADVRGTDLIVVRARRPYQPGPAVAEQWRAEEIAEVDSADMRYMARVVAPMIRRHPGVAVHLRVVAGGAGAALTGFAREAQLVVVGFRGDGGFPGLLLGSAGLDLVCHASCPVMIVRTDDAGAGDILAARRLAGAGRGPVTGPSALPHPVRPPLASDP